MENEYGHFGYESDPRDTQYLEFLRDNMIANGFSESLFFTSDTPTGTQDLGAIPGGMTVNLAVLHSISCNQIPDVKLIVTKITEFITRLWYLSDS